MTVFNTRALPADAPRSNPGVGRKRNLHGFEFICRQLAWIFFKLRYGLQTMFPQPAESTGMKHSLYLPGNFFPAWTARMARWLTTAVAAIFLSAPALALSDTDEEGVRTVVQAQLSALARDDAVAAYSFAAPNVRESVKSAAQFMAMVRSRYPAIYRPASTAFLKPEDHHGQVIQRVQLVDESGTAWLALYSLERQKDQSWRITGCQVIPNKGRMT